MPLPRRCMASIARTWWWLAVSIRSRTWPRRSSHRLLSRSCDRSSVSPAGSAEPEPVSIRPVLPLEVVEAGAGEADANGIPVPLRGLPPKGHGPDLGPRRDEREGARDDHATPWHTRCVAFRRAHPDEPLGDLRRDTTT